MPVFLHTFSNRCLQVAGSEHCGGSGVNDDALVLPTQRPLDLAHCSFYNKCDASDDAFSITGLDISARSDKSCHITTQRT